MTAAGLSGRAAWDSALGGALAHRRGVLPRSRRVGAPARDAR